MTRELELEVGIPIESTVPGAGEILSGVLPEGRYVTVRHIGHPDELREATRRMLEWADGQGVRFDVTQTDRGENWGCRLETYHTDPRVQPDMNRQTELAFKLTD